MEIFDRILNAIDDKLKSILITGRQITVQSISDINKHLGLFQSGELRFGNGQEPGHGFTGIRIGFPTFVYGSSNYVFAVIINDVLVAGITGGGSVSGFADLNTIYPIGIVITLGVSTNPATLFGIGTWTQIKGKVIVGLSSTETEFDTLDETGGEKSHTLLANEMPSHTHAGAAHSHTSAAHTHSFSATSGGQSADHVHTVQYGYWIGTPGGTYGFAAGGNYFTSGPLSTPGASSDHTHSVSGTSGSTTPGSTGTDGSSATGSSGGDEVHNNLQPYIVKYVWQRTA